MQFDIHIIAPTKRVFFNYVEENILAENVLRFIHFIFDNIIDMLEKILS